MASIHIERLIDAPVDAVWDALRDVGALHTRIVPGFVTDTRLDGDVRVVTFGNGVVARETIIDVDDDRRRVAYAVREQPFTHHSASNQVFADGPDRCRFVWIADLTPDDLSPIIAGMMNAGADILKATMESRAPLA